MFGSNKPSSYPTTIKLGVVWVVYNEAKLGCHKSKTSNPQPLNPQKSR